MATHLRALATRRCFYLDDIFLTGSTLTSTTADLEYARECLMSLGFVLNHKKSSTVPEQRIDFTNDHSALNRRKRLKLLDLVTKVANTNPNPTVRDLASLLDHCIQQTQQFSSLPYITGICSDRRSRLWDPPKITTLLWIWVQNHEASSVSGRTSFPGREKSLWTSDIK